MDLANLHRDVYDRMAEEYEERAESLRFVTEQASKELRRQLSAGSRVLDVGCGVGLLVEALRTQGLAAFGIDIAPVMVRYARKRNMDHLILEGDFRTHQFGASFDGLASFAFIHLFPKEVAEEILMKMHNILVPNGVLYIGTTKSAVSSEGIFYKEDYKVARARYRKNWTISEFRDSLEGVGFTILDVFEIEDPYGKVWMDFVVRKGVQPIDRSQES